MRKRAKMKLYFETYGCTANQGDAAIMKGLAREKKYRRAHTPAEADVLILSTCIVIDKTEQKMLHRLKELQKTGKKIIISGCLAGAHSDKALAVAPDALLLPPHSSAKLIEMLDGMAGRGRAEGEREEKMLGGAGGPSPEKKRTSHKKSALPREYTEKKAIIPISEGCPFACSFCITKKARGRLVSFPLDELVIDAKNALAAGCTELWITSQDNAAYGMDDKKGESILADVIKKFAALESTHDFRIRVGMMNPSTARRIIDALIEAYRDDHVFKFFHIPVQSGDDAILRKMRRNYTAGDFVRLVEKLRREFPNMVLSTDVIVGFPTENEAQFRRTCDVIRKIKPDIVNVKRFSPRTGTPAAKMDAVDSKVMKQRSTEMSSLSRSLGVLINAKYVGRTERMLVSERDNTSSVCRMDNYKPVVIKERLPIGRSVKAEVTDATATYLIGKRVP